MARNAGQGISLAQCSQHPPQRRVLLRLEWQLIRAFELDAHRPVVAVFPPAPTGLPGVPGTIVNRNELDEPAIAPDIEMR